MSFKDKSAKVQKAIIDIAPNPVAFVDDKAPSCGWCGAKVDVTAFKDALSEKEYGISKMCQTCQDDTFKES